VDIAAWLRELGLERYARALRENDVEAEILRTLTAEDLKELGVTSLGHRKRLLEAIAQLNDEASAASRAGAMRDAPGRFVPSEGERRHLTVLLCDLVGSTELASRLDPEDMGALMRAYHAACGEAVGRWDGHIAKLMGDGVLAYFGYPQAHEDDAERAVRAALDLVQAVAGLAAAGRPLAARPPPRPSSSPTALRTGVGKLLGIACEATCCSPRLVETKPMPKRRFAAHSTSLAGRKRSRSSFEPRPRSPGSWPSRGIGKAPATSWGPFTAGSRRASTPPI
jgi:class 3 adenylate cyclase